MIVTLEVSAVPPPAGVQCRVNTSGVVVSVSGIVWVGSVVGAAPVDAECVVFHAETEGELVPVQAVVLAMY